MGVRFVKEFLSPVRPPPPRAVGVVGAGRRSAGSAVAAPIFFLLEVVLLLLPVAVALTAAMACDSEGCNDAGACHQSTVVPGSNLRDVLVGNRVLR
jgi:hypothetical protein